MVFFTVAEHDTIADRAVVSEKAAADMEAIQSQKHKHVYIYIYMWPVDEVGHETPPHH